MKILMLVCSLSAMMLFVACRQQGPDIGQVQGAVMLDGQPLVRATVIFEPKSGGRASQAVTDSSGRYQLIYLRDIKGAIIGLHTVKIFTASEDNPKERVPARYNKQSTLTAKIVGGANEHNFSLTSK